MDIRFDRRVALVTGAGTGLGRSYALCLAARGAEVVVNDLGTGTEGDGVCSAPAERVVGEIRSRGGRAIPNFDSVAEPEAAERMVRAALDAFGRLDIVVNNAGIIRDKSFHKMPLEDFETVLQVHLLGSVYVTKAAFPFMRRQHYGRIVLTTSTSGLFGTFGQTNYCAAKLGVVGFMNALKHEGAGNNILVNSVAPMAATRLSEPSGIFPTELQSQLSPELVTPLVAYLCSESCQASGMILSVGGGFFGRDQVVEGPGIRFDSAEEVTPEMVAKSWLEITDMASARGFDGSYEQIAAALRATKKNEGEAHAKV